MFLKLSFKIIVGFIMGIRLEKREDVLVAELSGDYIGSHDTYKGDFQGIYSALEKTPSRVVVSLGAVSNIDRKGLAAIEKLCWKVAKDLGQIRLASPSENVMRYLERVDFTIPVYATLEKALESFGEDEFLEEDLFSDQNIGPLLEFVDWMPEDLKGKLYQLGVGSIGEFYDYAKNEPEPLRQHMGITEEIYRNLIKRAEQELPKDFVEEHNKPSESHARGLILEDEPPLTDD